MGDNGLDPKSAVTFLIGNKCDLKSRVNITNKQQEVDISEITAFAKKRNYEYYATSANTGENVNEVNWYDFIFLDI